MQLPLLKPDSFFHGAPVELEPVDDIIHIFGVRSPAIENNLRWYTSRRYDWSSERKGGRHDNIRSNVDRWMPKPRQSRRIK